MLLSAIALGNLERVMIQRTLYLYMKNKTVKLHRHGSGARMWLKVESSRKQIGQTGAPALRKSAFQSFLL